MAMDRDREPLVDPEVRAFVFSLVSALGGSSGGDDGRYVLGDDALAVLKDVKRWILHYDNRMNSLAVARLLAEANFVKGDLLEILAGTPDELVEGSFRAKIALACVDLLTQLTWPVDKPENQMRMDHFAHIPFLEAAQASYKRTILHYDGLDMLRVIVKVVLPAMAQPRRDRSPLEENIIKVVLYLLRNIAMIEKPQSAPLGESDEEIARSATIDAFHRQDIFDLILTFGSSIIDEYDLHDVEIMEILFQLVKGIDVEALFMDRTEFMTAQTRELKGLISKEKNMLAGYLRHAPTRHSRFVPMMWMDREGGKRTTVVGQHAYQHEELIIEEMDKNKKWRKPRRPKKNATETPAEMFDTKVPLTYSARCHLRKFVENFLDSSFNPLFTSIRKAMEREVDRIEEKHRRQYFFLVSWFLQAECARRRKAASLLKTQKTPRPDEVESFSLIASVLNQETFALLNRSMQVSQDEKEWRDLNAQMRCFTQILLTVFEMTESPLDEDQDIADNILSRLFYEQSTHDRIISLLRTFKDQSFGYLDACTELSHTFLRVLERYSKENADMQVRRIRRVRKKRNEAEGTSNEPESAATKEQDRQEAERVSTERRFDFPKYAARFITQGSVDTFFALIKHYKELNHEQLKRAHRFFYRVAFKMELTTYLLRADIISLLQRLIKGPDGLDPQCSVFKDWEELTRQVFRRLVKRMQERPSLSIEFLFSKMPNTVFFLEHGYERVPEKRFARAPAELEVKPGMERDQQIEVVVSILVNHSKSDVLAWIKIKLQEAVDERKAWEDASAANKTTSQQRLSDENTERQIQSPVPEPEGEVAESIKITHDREDIRLALAKDKHVRLLLTLLDFTKLDYLEAERPYAEWIIPGSIKSDRLKADLELIAKTEFAPPTFEEGKLAEDFVRRKYIHTARARRAGEVGSGSDSEGGSIASDIEEQAGLFPADGPDQSGKPKATRKRLNRSRHKKDDLLDERGLEERRAARRKLELERARKIKSQLYISPSDDESDEERDTAFFEMERRLKDRTANAVLQAQRKAAAEKDGDKSKGGRKRKSDLTEEYPSNGDAKDSDAGPLQKRSRLADILANDETMILEDDDLDPGTPSETISEKQFRLGGPPYSMTDNEEEPDSEADLDSDTPPSSERPSFGPGDENEVSKDLPEGGTGEEQLLVLSESDEENTSVPAKSLASKRRSLKIVDDDDDEE